MRKAVDPGRFSAPTEKTPSQLSASGCCRKRKRQGQSVTATQSVTEAETVLGRQIVRAAHVVREREANCARDIVFVDALQERMWPGQMQVEGLIQEPLQHRLRVRAENDVRS